ncbi:hypothetical protein Q8F55_007313 [Vanrija albida]|uniref:Uncharacterized protein n=1 Tax=Vanrija albida TaxID=181172 RepID=A0ABR3PZT7_9TREE
MKLLATLAILALTTAAPVDERTKLMPRAEIDAHIRSGLPPCGDFQRSCCGGFYCATSMDPCPNEKLCKLLIQAQQPCSPGVKRCCTGICPANNDPKNCPRYCNQWNIDPPSIY